MADTHKSIQSESESNASEVSLSVDHRLLRMETTYLIQILEMPKQKNFLDLAQVNEVQINP